MANNEIKTNAEIYREQRKARLAKAAKKKKSGKGEKILSAIVKIICIVLVAVLALYFVGKIFIGVFGIPQRLLTAATYSDVKVSVAEYNYYYRDAYQQAYNLSQQYDSQFSGYGSSYFNTTIDPAKQDYPGKDAPEDVVTWADYFKYIAPEKAVLMETLYNEAVANKFEPTEEQKKEMDTQIDELFTQLQQNADSSDFSLDNYIARTCGEGLNEKLYRELIERDTFVQYYLTSVQEKKSADISIDEVNKYYNENRDTIDIANVRLFAISYAEATEDSKDPVYTEAQAKERANNFVAEITDEASFIAAAKKFAPASEASSYAEDSATLAKALKKSSLTSLSEDFANWVFDSSRKTGEIKAFNIAAQKAYYIAFIVDPAHKDTGTAGADVRHLLVEAATTDDSGNKLSASEIATNQKNAKAKAEKLLKEWKDGVATEESFIELVANNTDDTASVETGGLYEDITADSQYVPEFLNWALAEHKVGDTEIVKTDYGYHIMYFVGADETQKWESDIRNTIASESYNTYLEDLYDKVSEETERKDVIIDFFEKRTAKMLSDQIANSASSTY